MCTHVCVSFADLNAWCTCARALDAGADPLCMCCLFAGIAVNDASSRDACLAVLLELLQAPEATAQLKPGTHMLQLLVCSDGACTHTLAAVAVCEHDLTHHPGQKYLKKHRTPVGNYNNPTNSCMLMCMVCAPMNGV